MEPLALVLPKSSSYEIARDVMNRIIKYFPNLEKLILVVDSKEKCATLFYWAVRFKHLNVVRVLITREADINVQDFNELTPLHMAAIRGHLNVVRELMVYSANVNIPDINGRTPLHNVVLFRCLDMVKALIEGGADVNAQDKRQETPEDLARALNYQYVVAYLESITFIVDE